MVTAFDGPRKVGTATGAANAPLTVHVPKAKLWSPDNPFLYRLRVQVTDGKRVVDDVESYFGMREIGTAKGADGKPRMTLNGKILFNLSTLDQGFWPDGLNTAPTDEALKFDLAQHKVLGFNTVRKHIKVEPDRWYYWADKLGLLVWQDMPATKTAAIPEGPWRAQFESELHEMVREHDSWTSIVAWVPFNEGWGEWDRDGDRSDRQRGQGTGPVPAGQRAQRSELLQLQGRLGTGRHPRLPPVRRAGDARP